MPFFLGVSSGCSVVKQYQVEACETLVNPERVIYSYVLKAPDAASGRCTFSKVRHRGGKEEMFLSYGDETSTVRVEAVEVRDDFEFI